MTPGLSLSMIVRDEERSLGSVLGDARQFCDEIIVVDTGSTDNTIDVALSFGATVHQFEWIEDFAAARNFALERCSRDWVLWLDADDRIPAEAQTSMAQIREEIIGRSDIEAVIVPYRTDFLPDNPNLCRSSVNRERFIRNGIGLRWIGAVHEFIPVAPERSVVRPDVWVEHRPALEHPLHKAERNLRILERAVANGETHPRTRFYLGVELAMIGRHHEALAVLEDLVSHAAPDVVRYDALCALAGCAKQVGDDSRQVGALMEAIELDPARAKAFVLLGVFYYEQKLWQKAMPFFAAASVVERPSLSGGQLAEPAYSWLPWDYLAVCASELGQYEEAMGFSSKALPENPERERIQRNVQFYLEQLEQTKSIEEIEELCRYVKQQS